MLDETDADEWFYGHDCEAPDKAPDFLADHVQVINVTEGWK